MKAQRRPQAQKARYTGEQVRAVQEQRRSNAAGLHKSHKAYSRTVKHKSQVEW